MKRWIRFYLFMLIEGIKMNREARTFWLSMAASILVLFGITFIAYRDALKGGLVWDAGSYLIDNPFITALTWENLKWMFTSIFVSNWHPLTWLSYTFDYLIYHAFWGVALTNVLLHCCNTILVFLLAIALVNRHRHREFLFRNTDLDVLVGAFIAALWFGIHPQHVESVAWLAERKDVLCQFFTLLTLLFYMKYAGTEGRWRTYHYMAALFCFLCAILSKPMAVTMPVLLMILDLYPLGRNLIEVETGQGLKIRWSLLLEKWPFILISLMLVLLTIHAQANAIASLEKLSYQVRILNAFNSLIVYISKMLFPVNLIPLYNDFPDPNDPFSLIPVIAFCLIMIVLAYLWTKGQKYWLAAWLFYVVALLPVLGLLQVGVQSSADRYAYLPTVPFYILIGCGLAYLFFHRSVYLKIVSTTLFIIPSVILLFLTQNQTRVWSNEFRLWNHIITVMPDHGPANSSLGDYYYNKGRYEEAIKYYEKAGRLGKLVMYSFPAMAIAFLKLNRLDEALQVYANILTKKYKAGIPESCIYYNVGLIYARKGLLPEAQQAFLRVKTDSDPEFLIASKLIPYLERTSPTATDENNRVFSNLPLCEKTRVYTAVRVYDKNQETIDQRY